VGWLLLPLAILIATATVYGRYHYVVDGLAGLALSVGAYFTWAVMERRDGRLKPAPRA
jgi:membrane-associated phospholipid phosphatase